MTCCGERDERRRLSPLRAEDRAGRAAAGAGLPRAEAKTPGGRVAAWDGMAGAWRLRHGFLGMLKAGGRRGSLDMRKKRRESEIGCRESRTGASRRAWDAAYFLRNAMAKNASTE